VVPDMWSLRSEGSTTALCGPIVQQTRYIITISTMGYPEKKKKKKEKIEKKNSYSLNTQKKNTSRKCQLPHSDTPQFLSFTLSLQLLFPPQPQTPLTSHQQWRSAAPSASQVSEVTAAPFCFGVSFFSFFLFFLRSFTSLVLCLKLLQDFFPFFFLPSFHFS